MGRGVTGVAGGNRKKWKKLHFNCAVMMCAVIIKYIINEY
jgi:hypothetical protein